jgi:hypothetical protein
MPAPVMDLSYAVMLDMAIAFDLPQTPDYLCLV